jgi:putative ABC transport system ATP-binding protein
VFGAGTPDENTALKNINLTVNCGNFVMVIGSNGAGKSTLYNTVSGTHIPTSGKVFLFDKEKGLRKDITREAECRRARYIGRIFQNPAPRHRRKDEPCDNMMLSQEGLQRPQDKPEQKHERRVPRTSSRAGHGP